MSEEKKQTPAEESEVKAEATEVKAGEAGQTAAEAPEKAEKETLHDKKKAKKLEAKVAELEKKLEEAAAAATEQNNKYLLLYAEYDNFRKRTQKEKDGIWTDAYSDALNKLLPVLDNLYRAVESNDPNGLAEGLAMTVKSYEEALGKMGVEEIPALGETFDPEKHCAVFHVDDEQYGENEIIEVLAKGYMKDGKVIRYSVVKVAN